jgi:hypothetical protein
MRRRFKQITTLEERLLKAAEELRIRARELPEGKEREAILAKAAQFEAQVSVNKLFVPQGPERNFLES